MKDKYPTTYGLEIDSPSRGRKPDTQMGASQPTPIYCLEIDSPSRGRKLRIVNH